MEREEVQSDNIAVWPFGWCIHALPSQHSRLYNIGDILWGFWGSSYWDQWLQGSSAKGPLQCLDDALHLESGRFFSKEFTDDAKDASLDDGSDNDEADGRDGKKHSKMPSACHFVTSVKLIHMSTHLCLLSAGLRCLMWLVMAKRSLSEVMKSQIKWNEGHNWNNGLTGLPQLQHHLGCSGGHSSSVLSHHLLWLQPWWVQ